MTLFAFHAHFLFHRAEKKQIQKLLCRQIKERRREQFSVWARQYELS